ncbi:helix-hairpin-helix domain-containing protein [Marinitenerispora sediminis]|uniref:ATP-dependent RecD2 DNA helicase-like helix-hairpin-helix domain-containing protein n=2 Tax=Marinitenerispora sediminis TaxID=1931232 RepID=A0A368T0V8_9ACTN|nr:helix-hairpin-helix domain-containing protein [Marinitenerispora sediminis]RCV53415.1 hypothetical protein DEF24_20735 [Marinitenerispora sediminis]RCV60637.1 hypothetical protein DEF23_04105 [Marinitenerispora sediminis]
MGAPERLVEPLLAALGPRAAEELAGDPWRLLTLPGATLQQADHCARRLLGDAASPDDPRRGRAVVGHLLHRAAREGHTAIEEARLAGALRSMGVRSPDDAMTAALDDGDVLAFEVFPDSGAEDFTGDEAPEMPEPDRHYGLARVGLAEQDLGEGLVRLLATSEPIMDSATARETVEALGARLGVEIAPETAAALVTLALRGVCVLTHGPAAMAAVGQVVAGAAAIAADSEVGVAVAAPTARAAAALRAVLPGDAPEVVSLARLLETGAGGGHGRGAERPIEAGLVVVAGAMALDVEQAAALVDACADGTHLVLLADPALAPSALPGQVAADLAASGTAAVAALPDAPDPGPVARLAAAVADGELAQVAAPGREVVVVPADSAGEAAHRAVQLIADSIPRALGIAADEVQIVTATRGGEAGADALNAACKARLNPGPGAWHGFDPGDRVLFAAAGPGHLAGEVGRLRETGEDGAVVELADGTAVPVSAPGTLRHGWAMTIAAANGTGWPAVVAVLPPEVRWSRPQVYTAVTRAERHLSIVHAAGPALAQGVREVPTVTRYTRLVDVLREG